MKILVLLIHSVIISFTSLDGSKSIIDWYDVNGTHFVKETESCITINTWFYEDDTLLVTFTGRCRIIVEIDGEDVYEDYGVPFTRITKKILIKHKQISN